MASKSWASPEATARSMRGNRSRDTSLELVVRRALHAAGFRYRVGYSPIAGLRSRADIVFTRLRIAIYLDGCFWHGCPQHGTTPRVNADYWVPKLARNQERDTATTNVLTGAGWIVLRIWEHEGPAVVVDHIAAVVTDASTDRDAS